MDRTKSSRRGFWVAGLLVALTLAAYWPILRYGFISYDDTDYVTQNVHVQAGLTWENVLWAFRTFAAANWHPVTWLSHMLDVQVYGLQGEGHHLTNLLLHLANTLLLLRLLDRMTGAFWRSALVAALFALHPLHVESVAWVAERKDVLSACFFLLTLLAYVRYVSSLKPRPAATRNPQSAMAASASRITQHAARWYVLALVLFALGLMSKPMLVTLPCVLLLLDWWPLGRLQLSPLRMGRSMFLRLVREKLPFFALSAAASALTLLAQQGGGAVMASAQYGFWGRLGHAGPAYLKYLSKAVYPTGLAIFYPLPFVDRASGWAFWQCAGAWLVVLGVSVLALVRSKRQPWFAVGWFWFLGMLVPVIGLVQVGSQAMADRYTYLPLLGAFICLAWSLPGGQPPGLKPAVPGTVSKAPARAVRPAAVVGWSPGVLACALAATAVLACTWLTRRQVGYWQDDQHLFEHALRVTDHNAPAHTGVAMCLARSGQYGLALAQCRAATQADPSYVAAWELAGNINALLGNPRGAVTNYEAALHWKAASPLAWIRLGQVQAQLGEVEEAERDYRMALHYRADLAQAHRHLGALLLARGKEPEALEQLAQAARLSPNTSKAQAANPSPLDAPFAAEALATAEAMVTRGRLAEAMAGFRALLRLQPDIPEAHERLGLLLAHSGKLDEASEQLREALRLLEAGEPDDAGHPGQAARPSALAEFRYNLGLTLAMQGRLGEAVTNYRRVLALAPNSGPALNDLAWILATAPQAQLRNGPEALRLAQHACELTQQRDPRFLSSLAAAYAETGQFIEATRTAEKARDLALAAGDKALADSLETKVALYRAQKPFRQ